MDGDVHVCTCVCKAASLNKGNLPRKLRILVVPLGGLAGHEAHELLLHVGEDDGLDGLGHDLVGLHEVEELGGVDAQELGTGPGGAYLGRTTAGVGVFVLVRGGRINGIGIFVAVLDLVGDVERAHEAEGGRIDVEVEGIAPRDEIEEVAIVVIVDLVLDALVLVEVDPVGRLGQHLLVLEPGHVGVLLEDAVGLLLVEGGGLVESAVGHDGLEGLGKGGGADGHHAGLEDGLLGGDDAIGQIIADEAEAARDDAGGLGGHLVVLGPGQLHEARGEGQIAKQLGLDLLLIAAKDAVGGTDEGRGDHLGVADLG